MKTKKIQNMTDKELYEIINRGINSLSVYTPMGFLNHFIKSGVIEKWDKKNSENEEYIITFRTIK
jgi:hypothetical protein